MKYINLFWAQFIQRVSTKKSHFWHEILYKSFYFYILLSFFTSCILLYFYFSPSLLLTFLILSRHDSIYIFFNIGIWEISQIPRHLGNSPNSYRYLRVTKAFGKFPRYPGIREISIFDIFDNSILLSFYPSILLSSILLFLNPSIPQSFYPSILLSFYPSILLSLYSSILISFYRYILLCFYSSIFLSF